MFLKYTGEKWKLRVGLILLNLRGLCWSVPPELVAEEVTHSEDMIHLPKCKHVSGGMNPVDLIDHSATDAAVAPTHSQTSRSEEAFLTVSMTDSQGMTTKTTHTLSSNAFSVTFAVTY